MLIPAPCVPPLVTQYGNIPLLDRAIVRHDMIPASWRSGDVAQTQDALWIFAAFAWWPIRTVEPSPPPPAVESRPRPT